MVKRGFVFTHQRFLDPKWKPGPHDVWSQAPKAQMWVTKVTKTTVWYAYLRTEQAVAHMPREQFEALYGQKEEQPS